MAPVPTSGSRAAGIALRLLATFLFAVMTLFVRLASAEAPVGQVVFHRAAWSLIPIVFYLMVRGQFPAGLRTANPWGHVRRNGYSAAGTFLSFVSIAHLPLAFAAALGFLAPLLSVPAGSLALGERPGLRVTLAAVAGFIGVLVMLAPAMQGPAPDWGMLIGVAAGLGTALVTVAAKVEIKRLTATEPPGTIAFYFALLVAAGGLATWPFGWAEVSPAGLAWLIGAGLTGGLAHIAMTEAVARAPISTLAPFEYTTLLWAMAFDIAVFALLPGVAGLAGCAIIVAAAALAAFGDRIPLRRAPAPASTPPAA